MTPRLRILRKSRPVSVDARGSITLVLEGRIRVRGVLLVRSKAGSVRGNHYHRKDSHYAYLLSGKMRYIQKPARGGHAGSAVLRAGDMVYTPPRTVHAMRFLEDTVFLAFATRPRGPKEYEADTVRVRLE